MDKARVSYRLTPKASRIIEGLMGRTEMVIPRTTLLEIAVGLLQKKIEDEGFESIFSWLEAGRCVKCDNSLGIKEYWFLAKGGPVGPYCHKCTTAERERLTKAQITQI